MRTHDWSRWVNMTGNYHDGWSLLPLTRCVQVRIWLYTPLPSGLCLLIVEIVERRGVTTTKDDSSKPMQRTLLENVDETSTASVKYHWARPVGRSFLPAILDNNWTIMLLSACERSYMVQGRLRRGGVMLTLAPRMPCLLYTSDAADE